MLLEFLPVSRLVYYEYCSRISIWAYFIGVKRNLIKTLISSQKKFIVHCKNCTLHNGGGGIRTHEPLRDGITHDPTLSRSVSTFFIS